MNTNPTKRSAPRALPLLGHVVEFARDPLSFLEKTAREHGAVVPLHLANRRFVLISDPGLIEHALVRDARSYQKDAFTKALSDVLGNGLLTSDGDIWRRQRKLASVAFQPKRVDAYADVMVRLAEEISARIADGESRDLHTDMMSLTLDVVAETLFGAVVRADATTFSRALEVFQRRYEGIFGTGIMLDRRIPIPIHVRMWRASASVDRILMRIIGDRRNHLRERTDLLETLLAARDDDGSGMSDAQVRDEAVTLFMAGHETTALTLTYAFRLLTENPEARAKLEAEVDQVLGDRAASIADIASLTYTEAVVKECLRLYPPVWLIAREAIEATEVDGFPIDKGDSVAFSQWVMHRSALYWEAPLVFRPERWVGDAAKSVPRFAFFPFGGGPRVCIGNHFAMLEAIALLASIVRTHRVDVDLTAPFELVPSVTMRPSHAVPARFVRRRSRRAT